MQQPNEMCGPGLNSDSKKPNVLQKDISGSVGGNCILTGD